MVLNYKALSSKPQIFLRLTGVTVTNFQEIVNKVGKAFLINGATFTAVS